MKSMTLVTLSPIEIINSSILYCNWPRYLKIYSYHFNIMEIIRHHTGSHYLIYDKKAHMLPYHICYLKYEQHISLSLGSTEALWISIYNSPALQGNFVIRAHGTKRRRKGRRGKKRKKVREAPRLTSGLMYFRGMLSRLVYAPSGERKALRCL